MRLVEYLALGLAMGLPSALLQIYLYRRERVRRRSLWSSWSELQTELARVLHKPHLESEPLDKLLEKLETFTAAGISLISSDDRNKLTIMLRQKMDDPNQPKSERQRAEFLLMAMPRAEHERKARKIDIDNP